MDFNQLKLSKALLRAVQDAGYTEPSPIQQKAIPPVLAGRDLLGCAQTGTGKTAAFALPILQTLALESVAHKRPIRALVMTPTRELALQIYECFVQYGKHTPLRTAAIFGGVGQAPQVAALRRGVDILVATPGRLNDLIGQGFIDLSRIKIFVLDEADRMLDMGFINDVKKVLRCMPAKRQTLLFSATMPKEIVTLADSLLHNPEKVYVTPQSSTVDSVQQFLYKVDKANKRHLLAHLLQQPTMGSALVFTRTKHGADRVARDLMRVKITASAIHGNKSQGARQKALAEFKAGAVQVLVATDIAARGIDIQELSHVINFDLPNESETYVHRIGRTGRAGNTGIALSFCCADELEYLQGIQKLIGFQISEVKEHGWPMGSAPARPAISASNKPVRIAPENKINKGSKIMAKTGKANSRPPSQAGAPNRTPTQGKTQSNPNNRGPRPPRKGGQGKGRPEFNPYDTLQGSKAIVTKRPVWSTGEAPTATEEKVEARKTSPPARRPQQNPNRKPVQTRDNEQRRPQVTAKPRPVVKPSVPKNPNKIYDFSEKELSEDGGLKVINRANGEAKYASFDDFLKKRED